MELFYQVLVVPIVVLVLAEVNSSPSNLRASLSSSGKWVEHKSKCHELKHGGRQCIYAGKFSRLGTSSTPHPSITIRVEPSKQRCDAERYLLMAILTRESLALHILKDLQALRPLGPLLQLFLISTSVEVGRITLFALALGLMAISIAVVVPLAIVVMHSLFIVDSG